MPKKEDVTSTDNKMMYYKVCVLANNVPDSTDDIITKKDIKTVMTNLVNLNLNFDINHTTQLIRGVEIVESYISSSDEDIGGKIAPSGSWNMVVGVINQDLNNQISNGTIKGVSLFTKVDDNVLTLNTSTFIRYKEIANKSSMHPIILSFVSVPANGYPLEQMTKEQYISKGMPLKGGDDKMSENNNETNNNETNQVNNPQEEVSWLRSLVGNMFNHGGNTPVQVTSKGFGTPTPNPVGGGGDQQGATGIGTNADEILQNISDGFKAISKLTEQMNTQGSVLESISNSLNIKNNDNEGDNTGDTTPTNDNNNDNNSTGEETGDKPDNNSNSNTSEDGSEENPDDPNDKKKQQHTSKGNPQRGQAQTARPQYTQKGIPSRPIPSTAYRMERSFESLTGRDPSTHLKK